MAAVLLLLAMMASPTTTTTITPVPANAMSTNNSSGDGAIRAAQVRHNRIFGVYVVLLGLTVIGTYFVWSSGNKVQDAIQADATARITEAQSTALQADARSKELEKDNLVLKGQVATLQADASAQQERAAVAETNLLELRGQVEPRRLTASQKSELTKLLTRGGSDGAAIVTPLMDGEASDFAGDFNSALQAANWTTLRIVNRISSSFGIAVVTCEGTKEPVLLVAKRLSDALSAAGIPHESKTFKDGDASTSPSFQAGYVYLVVEHKPLPVAKAK
jgi:hypothetical protein